MDYRRLNTVTQNDVYAMPRTQDCLNTMAGSKMFSTMNILSANKQVPIAERHSTTAFTTKYCLFEFTTMMFSVMAMPATYRWLMELVLSGLQWSLCQIYLDNVIMFSRDFDEQVDWLDKVLIWLGSPGLKLKGGRHVVFSTRVVFLGHALSKEGILPDPENVAKILNWPVPKMVHEARGILA